MFQKTMINCNKTKNIFFSKLLVRKSFSSPIVKIKYSDLRDIYLKNNSQDIFSEIEKAYGHDGLGALVIQDVPNHLEKKTKLLNLARDLAALPKNELEKLERKDLNYGLGWSHGKEKLIDGQYDFLKGSFYGKLNKESEKNSEDKTNIWPETLPELKPSFHELGNQIRDTAYMLYSTIDAFIKSKFPSYNKTINLLFKSLQLQQEDYYTTFLVILLKT